MYEEGIARELKTLVTHYFEVYYVENHDESFGIGSAIQGLFFREDMGD